MIPDHIRAKLGALRDEFARNKVERGPGQWRGLHIETRVVLLMLAGIDPTGDQDLTTLAARDWREFTPPEQAAIRTAGNAMRWQLNGAATLLCGI